jgi:hypothetical protein
LEAQFYRAVDRRDADIAASIIRILTDQARGVAAVAPTRRAAYQTPRKEELIYSRFPNSTKGLRYLHSATRATV